MSAETRDDLTEAWSAVLAAYEHHLVAERDLSPHSVRAYLTDIESLGSHAARQGVVDPVGLCHSYSAQGAPEQGGHKVSHVILPDL